MPNIYDNINLNFVEGLRRALENSYKSDFCVGYFNLRGWRKVSDLIDDWNGGDNKQCRLLIGMQKAESELYKELYIDKADTQIDLKKAKQIKIELAKEFRDQLTQGYPSNIDEQGLRRLVNQLKTKKVVVKIFLRYQLHAKLYLTFRHSSEYKEVGYLGSSNLTLSGLSDQGELNVDIPDKSAFRDLLEWFNDKWEDDYCFDISEELIEIIEESWAGERMIKPYYIYLKMAYHLSREARSGLNEFKIPIIFNNELLEFQKKAVLIAAHHLNKRGGVLIGDVVGLGKTMTACALAKIFEDDFLMETLVICPKNLTKMWGNYIHKYRLRAKVFSLSKILTNAAEDLNRYRIVVIDESHYLRSRAGKRYKKLQSLLRYWDSKVILLTATPYNKDFSDLSNQLRLFIPDDQDLGIAPEIFIDSIGGLNEFQAKYQHHYRSLPAFEKSEYIDDWRELMRLFLVRRTRTFIKENYAERDENIGRKYLTFANGDRSYFPDRMPKRIDFALKKEDPEDQYAKLYSEAVVFNVNDMKLARYGIGNHLKPIGKIKPTEKELDIISNLTKAGKRLMGFSRTNLFKRLESSGYSFLLSAFRMMVRNYLFIHAIENKLPIPIGSQEVYKIDDFTDEMDWEDTEGNKRVLHITNDVIVLKQLVNSIYQEIRTNHIKKYDWIDSSYFKRSFISSLEYDCKILRGIIELSKNWKPENDRKLKTVENLLKNTHPEEKVIIFTQYADTATYIYKELKKREISHLECVTGSADNPTVYAERFSPVSNDKLKYRDTDNEIRVLVSTDVLSEGQNLQDAHIVLNYDLPWTLIRLVQRVGRVDRIGQKSNIISSYFFFPEEGVDKIIALRRRLENRLKENQEVVGSDEKFFDEKEEIVLNSLYNEKSGILDDDDLGEIDLASYAYQIWKNAIDKNPKLKKLVTNLPDVVLSSKKTNKAEDEEGVLIYARTEKDNDLLTWISKDEKIITQSQLRILEAAACDKDEKAVKKMKQHHELVKKGIKHVQIVESETGGALGRKSSAKYRVWMRMSKWKEEFPAFITKELKNTLDDFYKYQLKTYAKDAINRQLRAGIGDADLADLLVTLREEDKLCIISKKEVKRKEPKIICSMGLIRE